MSNLFKNGRNGKAANLDEDLSIWNVEKVTSMGSMFDGCLHFNADVQHWDVKNV